MDITSAIKLEYEHLHDGEALAGELCPSCSGGSSSERTLSVSKRDGKLLYICHRASCGVRGVAYAGSSGHSSTKQVSTRGAVGRWAAREAESIGVGDRKYLSENYSLEGRHISKWGLGWDSLTDRLVLPVLSFRGEMEGATLRSLSGQKPKSLSHTESMAMAWYLNHSSDSLIIVEDQLSAIRAADYVNAVALLGVNLSDDRASVIRAAKFDEVFIALDNDAFQLTLDYSIKYRSYLQLVPLKLEKDIKDMSTKELEAWLHSNAIMGETV